MSWHKKLILALISLILLGAVGAWVYRELVVPHVTFVSVRDYLPDYVLWQTPGQLKQLDQLSNQYKVVPKATLEYYHPSGSTWLPFSARHVYINFRVLEQSPVGNIVFASPSRHDMEMAVLVEPDGQVIQMQVYLSPGFIEAAQQAGTLEAWLSRGVELGLAGISPRRFDSSKQVVTEILNRDQSQPLMHAYHPAHPKLSFLSAWWQPPTVLAAVEPCEPEYACKKDGQIVGSCTASLNGLPCSELQGGGICEGAATCGSGPICGDGFCTASVGETCSSCPTDCGACAAFCGDGSCNNGETCSTCANDCGTCNNGGGGGGGSGGGGSGSWGSCGSCGNCDNSPGGSGSHPSGECIATPDGGCTWDISCRGGGGGGGGGGNGQAVSFSCGIRWGNGPSTLPVCGTAQISAEITSESGWPHDKVQTINWYYQNVTGNAGGLIGTVNPATYARGEVKNAGGLPATVVVGLREGQFRVRAEGKTDGFTCTTPWHTITVGPLQPTPPPPHTQLEYEVPGNPFLYELVLRVNGKGPGSYYVTSPDIVPHDSSVVISWSPNRGRASNCLLSVYGYNGGSCGVNCISQQPVSCMGGSRYLHHITGQMVVTIAYQDFETRWKSSSHLLVPSAPSGQANDLAVSCYANTGTLQTKVFDATHSDICPAVGSMTGIPNATVSINSTNGSYNYSATTNASGDTSTTVGGGAAYNLTVTSAPGEYLTGNPLICGGGLPVSVSSGTTQARQLGLRTAKGPWWQVEGGPISVRGMVGTVLQSLIPSTCNPPGCEPSLILNTNGGNTEGYIITGGGDVDVSETGGRQINQVDENRHNWVAKLNSLPMREDYNYFYTLLDLPENPQSDFEANAGNAGKPTGDVANDGAEAYFHSGELVIGQAWNVTADEKVVVVVEGSVRINRPIQVAEGGYLMIVVSGNIVIDPLLGTSYTGTDVVLEGVYVADRQIQLPSRGAAAGGDIKFIGEGTFVGWSGFVLDRDYANTGTQGVYNNVAPTEVFRFRPDFLRNAPDALLRARYNWQEINP